MAGGTIPTGEILREPTKKGKKRATGKGKQPTTKRIQTQGRNQRVLYTTGKEVWKGQLHHRSYWIRGDLLARDGIRPRYVRGQGYPVISKKLH